MLVSKKNGVGRRSFIRGAVVASCIGGMAALFVIHGTRPVYSQPVDLSKVTTAWNKVAPAGDERATLAGGCFWAMQAMFSQLKGVDRIVAGYAGGSTPNPTYEQVCTETTGHAETIQIDFNPKVITYNKLLDIYFHSHNPTTLNQQGDDVGTSYRSVIFYNGPVQLAEAKQAIKNIEAEHVWDGPVVTQLVPISKFYQAEDYHQNYFVHNPDTGYTAFVVAPKVAKFRAHYKSLIK